MASSELMPSTASTSSRKRDLRGNPVSRPETKSGFHRFQSQQLVLDDNENGARDLSSSSAVSVDGFYRNASAGGGVVGKESALMSAEIRLLDAAGAIAPIMDAPAVRKKTAEEVWSEIVAGGKSEESGRVDCKEEMMTLEDFLVKAGAVDENALMTDMEGEVKLESGLSGEMFSLDAAYMSRQGSLDSVGMMGYGDGASGLMGIGRRRSASIFEPLDKAAQQRQKRMIKNRESAARSRERKQAYQNELESMAVRLEEENELLLKEKAERTKARRKMLMEKIIPVEEKRRPARCLRRVRSMLW